MLRINLGCGQTPTRGWRNIDNSLSLRLAQHSFAAQVLRRLGLLDQSQLEFIQYARNNAIEYGDAAKGLSVTSGSVDVLYSSHMLEHLDRTEARVFLEEAWRLLRPGGIIRIAVPDIKMMADQYLRSGDAEAFMKSTNLCSSRPRSLAQRLRALLLGPRHHLWMYDGDSLAAALREYGFLNAKAVPAGHTRIAAHEPLDLCERSSESVYVEAEKPPD